MAFTDHLIRNTLYIGWKAGIAFLLLFDTKDRRALLILLLIIDLCLCFLWDISSFIAISREKDNLNMYFAQRRQDNQIVYQDIENVSQYLNQSLIKTQDNLLIGFKPYHYVWHIIFTVLNILLICAILSKILFIDNIKITINRKKTERIFTYLKTILGVLYLIQYFVLPMGGLATLNDIVDDIDAAKELMEEESVQ